ncbi:hypothetical protein [Streptomyces sp. NBC_00091]|uniref:hypothetical protein n=1 Tax=Streptomyces sp. NBC_00091 TaxID=2975648 RepID=UPI00225AEB52|nr:hypothetical protein [Streptomyces sp. NBC_00091]MCX5379605.1 hypothetical protein [Streptomyces sp. NBC_00091]
MHPTRTSTKLLLGAACAVSAVSGCVNVSPPQMGPAAAPSEGLAPRHEPRGGPGALPVVVQAPALEALKAVPREAGRPTAPTTAGRGAARTVPGPRVEAGEAVQAPPEVPDIPGPAEPAGRAEGGSQGGPRHAGPDAQLPPGLARELPVRPADVCALGRRHGNWDPQSPEARICAGVEGG